MTSASTAIAISRTATAISTVPRPMEDWAAAGGVAGATVWTTGAGVGAFVSSVALSALLLGAPEDNDVAALLSEVALVEVSLVEVAADDVADEPVTEPAAGPDDRPAELGVAPDGLCELSTVVVVSSADCSGAASGGRDDHPVARALVPSPVTMTAAPMTVSTARIAARVGPAGQMRRAGSTAIKPP